MPDTKKKHVCSFYMNEEMKKRLCEYCEREELPTSVVIRRAVSFYLRQAEKNKKEDPGAP